MEFSLVEVVILGLLTVAFCRLLRTVPITIKQHYGSSLETPDPRADQGVSQSTILDDSKHASPSPGKTAAPKDQAPSTGPETTEPRIPRLNMLSADPAHITVPETFPRSEGSSLTHEDYTIGWMCALPIELTAAAAMLDQIHPDLPKANAADSNTYTLGSIGSHNVALAGLPNGSYGTNSAAVAAFHMLSAFPNLRFGLMVGIGGGAPSEDHDIRLGDIVVSKPRGKDGGVVQIDLGKATGTGFKRTGILNRPPTALLTALTKLEAEHFGGSEKVPLYVGRLHKKYPGKAKEFSYRLSDDNLYQTNYEHNPADKACRNCDVNELVCRENRESHDPVIHYGTIASSNQVIKHGPTRDRLQREHEVLCFEMEAAGLMNDFPCIVIRGICDYADSHKNKRWQPYAAAVAAAYTRELLEQIPANAVDSTLLAKEIASLRETITGTVTSAITHGLRPVQDDLGKRKSNEILDWLSQSNHEAKYADSINSDRYKEGTGQWFLNSSEFQSWLHKPGQTLFCPGIPGSGKTIIVSLAIQNLLASLSRNKSIVAFLYCDYGRIYEQTTDGLLTALLRQFSQDNHQLPDLILSLYRVCDKQKRRPRRDEVNKTLTSVLKSYDRAFVIIDALDECSEQTRGELLFSVLRLQKETSINLLATSRPVPEIERLFQADPRLEIRASEEDVEIYLQSRLRELPDWVREDQALQQKIKHDISAAIDGMFLLARLHFDSLKGKQTKGEIEEALDAFMHPQGDTYPLMIAYDEALRRISDQTPNEKKWAQKVLSWVILARRPLSPSELQHALAVRPGDRKLHSKNFPRPANIVSLCAGLVLINKESNVVQLVHYTAKEYFERYPPEWIQSAPADLARSCLRYLTLDAFAKGPCFREEEYMERASKHEFFSYAACYWGEHSQDVEADVKDVAWTFLFNDGYTSSACQVIETQLSPWKVISKSPEWSRIHIVAFFGLSTYFQLLMDEQLNQRKRLEAVNSMDQNSRTPLHLAGMNGRKALVKMLVDCGARPHDYPFHGTPLCEAAEHGQEAVVKIFLDRVKDDAKPEYHQALYAAVEHGHEAVVKILIDAQERLDVDPRKTYGYALAYAATHGHEGVVKMLVDLGDRTDVNLRNYLGQTPLSAAAARGYKTIVKMLIDLEEKVDVNSTDNDEQTPLSLAAFNGHEAIVKMLIDLGDRVDVDWKDINNCTPLSLASESGHEAVVKMLIDLGDRVDVDSKAVYGQTPLYFAASKGNPKVVKLLVDLGEKVDINSRNRFGKTPLGGAEEGRKFTGMRRLGEYEKVVNILRGKGACL